MGLLDYLWDAFNAAGKQAHANRTVGQAFDQPYMPASMQAYGKGLLSQTPSAVGQQMAMSFAPFGVTVYHGTPHSIQGNFDLSKIGTGQGAQAFGHGIYFAENPAVAKSYRDLLGGQEVRAADGTLLSMAKPAAPGPAAERTAREWMTLTNGDPGAALKLIQGGSIAPSGSIDKEAVNLLEQWQKAGARMAPAGRVYQQDLPDEVLPRMLQWDKPLSEQPEAVRRLLPDPAASAERRYLSQLPPQAQTTAQRMINGPESARTGDAAAPDWASLYRAAPNVDHNAIHDIVAARQKAWDRFLTSAPNQEDAAMLRDAGIPGLSYLDAGSRGAGSGTLNHVIWDQELLNRMIPQAVP